MNSNLLKDMILPSFWLFFFLVYSNTNDRNNSLINQNKTEIKKVTGSAGNDNSNISVTKKQSGQTIYVSTN